MRTASQLNKHGSYEPIFLISAQRESSLDQEVAECRKRGIACVYEEQLLARPWSALMTETTQSDVGGSPRSRVPRVRGVAGRMAARAEESLGLVLAVVLRLAGIRASASLWRTAIGRWHRRRVLRRLRRAERYGYLEYLLRAELDIRKVLTRLQPEVVCLSEDIPGMYSGPFIRAARRKGIPSIVIPFTIPNVLETAESCINIAVPWHAAPAYRAAAFAYPRWSMLHKGRTLLRSKPGLVHASEIAGLAPPNPWIVNSGSSDRIAVESERMLEVYRAAGFPEAQLALTGSCGDDMLFAAAFDKTSRREVVYRQLGLPAGKRLLLSALVPDQLVSGVPECEFDRYSELLEFWVKALAAWNREFNVVLKINPRYRREEFTYLEKFGVAVAPHDTIELVPLADIYVASISSTLRWAAACGIPSINYDVYQYRYGDFVGAPGIVHVETKEAFVHEVNRLAQDQAYWSELLRAQAADAPRWALMDGKSTHRLVELLDSLCGAASMRSRNRLPGHQREWP